MTILLIHTTPIDLSQYTVSASTFLINKKEWKKLWKDLDDTQETNFELTISNPPNEYSAEVEYDQLKSSFTIIKKNPDEAETALITEIMRLNEPFKAPIENYLSLLKDIINTTTSYIMEKLYKKAFNKSMPYNIYNEFNINNTNDTNKIEQFKLFIQKKLDEK